MAQVVPEPFQEVLVTAQVVPVLAQLEWEQGLQDMMPMPKLGNMAC